MSFDAQLGHRAISAYNRLSRDLASLNYVLRVAKPSGTVGEVTLRSLNQAIGIANRLFCREAELPQFAMLDPGVPLTVADFAILVTRLSAAAVAFEERYAHLAGQASPSHYSTDGLPSPHR